MEINDEAMEELKIANRNRIGQEIADMRSRHGLTLNQLSELSGVSMQNLTKIEHGRYNVSIDILGKVAAAMGAIVTIAEE